MTQDIVRKIDEVGAGLIVKPISLFQFRGLTPLSYGGYGGPKGEPFGPQRLRG
jgi:hypothetical protein